MPTAMPCPPRTSQGIRQYSRLDRLACLAAACLCLPLASAQAVAEAPRAASGTMLDCLNIRDLTMGEFAALLFHSGLLQVVASNEAAPKGISVYLRGVPALEALEAVCRGAGLVCRPSASGVTYVFTQQEFNASRGLYNDEVVDTVQLRHAAAADVGETLRNLFADRVVWVRPSRELGNPQSLIDDALSRMDRLTEYEELRTNSGRNSDSTRSDYDRRQSVRYPNDRNDRGRHTSREATDRDGSWDVGLLEQSRTLLREHRPDRLPADQGMGEAGRDSARFGIVFVSVFPSTNTLLLRSTDGRALEQIKSAVHSLDRPTPQVLLEVKVLELELGQGKSTGIDWLFRDGDGYAGVHNWRPGRFDEPPSETTGNNLEAAITNQLTSVTGFAPRTAVIGVISEQLIARIRLMQSEGRLVQLATPTLLVANDEASRVFVGSRAKFLSRVQRSAVVVSEGGQTSGGDLEPVIEEQNIGMNLLINPRIHADRSVTLRILQEETDFGEIRTINYGEMLPLQVQDILQRSVVSTIVAQSGNWVVIGGLIREGTTDRQDSVPVLHRLPLLGQLFKSSGASRTRSELIIMIRPLVLVAPGEEGPASRELVERLSRHPSAAKAEFPDLGVDFVPSYPAAPDKGQSRASNRDDGGDKQKGQE